jgi:hypothetical protein
MTYGRLIDRYRLLRTGLSFNLPYLAYKVSIKYKVLS